VLATEERYVMLKMEILRHALAVPLVARVVVCSRRCLLVPLTLESRRCLFIPLLDEKKKLLE